MHVRARPVHTRLLGAGIPICEHMTGSAASRRGLPLRRGAAQGQGDGDLPGARLCRPWLSERGGQPVGDDRSVEIIDAAMFDGEAEIRIGDAGPRPGTLVSTTTRRRLTFCRQFIRAVFSCPTKQPLVEADAVQLDRIAFEPEDVAKFSAAFGNAEAQRCSSQPLGGLAGGPSQRWPSSARRGSGTPSPDLATNGPRASARARS